MLFVERRLLLARTRGTAKLIECLCVILNHHFRVFLDLWILRLILGQTAEFDFRLIHLHRSIDKRIVALGRPLWIGLCECWNPHQQNGRSSQYEISRHTILPFRTLAPRGLASCVPAQTSLTPTVYRIFAS